MEISFDFQFPKSPEAYIHTNKSDSTLPRPPHHPQPRPSSSLLMGRSPRGRGVALYARANVPTDWWAGPATEHGSPTSCVRNQPMTRSLRCSSSLALTRIMLKKPRRPSSLAAPGQAHGLLTLYLALALALALPRTLSLPLSVSLTRTGTRTRTLTLTSPLAAPHVATSPGP